MLRKLSIIVIVTFVGDKVLRIYVAMWTLSAFLMVQMFAEPFALKYLNRMEALGLAVITVCLNLALLWQSGTVRGGTPSDTLLSVGLLTLQFGLLVLFGLVLAREATNKVARWLAVVQRYLRRNEEAARMVRGRRHSQRQTDGQQLGGLAVTTSVFPPRTVATVSRVQDSYRAELVLRAFRDTLDLKPRKKSFQWGKAAFTREKLQEARRSMMAQDAERATHAADDAERATRAAEDAENPLDRGAAWVEDPKVRAARNSVLNTLFGGMTQTVLAGPTLEEGSQAPRPHKQSLGSAAERYRFGGSLSGDDSCSDSGTPDVRSPPESEAAGHLVYIDQSRHVSVEDHVSGVTSPRVLSSAPSVVTAVDSEAPAGLPVVEVWTPHHSDARSEARPTPRSAQSTPRASLRRLSLPTVGSTPGPVSERPARPPPGPGLRRSSATLAELEAVEVVMGGGAPATEPSPRPPGQPLPTGKPVDAPAPTGHILHVGAFPSVLVVPPTPPVALGSQVGGLDLPSSVAYMPTRPSLDRRAPQPPEPPDVTPPPKTGPTHPPLPPDPAPRRPAVPSPALPPGSPNLVLERPAVGAPPTSSTPRPSGDPLAAGASPPTPSSLTAAPPPAGSSPALSSTTTIATIATRTPSSPSTPPTAAPGPEPAPASAGPGSPQLSQQRADTLPPGRPQWAPGIGRAATSPTTARASSMWTSRELVPRRRMTPMVAFTPRVSHDPPEPGRALYGGTSRMQPRGFSSLHGTPVQALPATSLRAFPAPAPTDSPRRSTPDTQTTTSGSSGHTPDREELPVTCCSLGELIDVVPEARATALSRTPPRAHRHTHSRTPPKGRSEVSQPLEGPSSRSSADMRPPRLRGPLRPWTPPHEPAVSPVVVYETGPAFAGFPDEASDPARTSPSPDTANRTSRHTRIHSPVEPLIPTPAAARALFRPG